MQYCTIVQKAIIRASDRTIPEDTAIVASKRYIGLGSANTLADYQTTIERHAWSYSETLIVAWSGKS